MSALKKVVPKLRQEVKVDIVTSDDIKIYYTGKFQDFTDRYIVKCISFSWASQGEITVILSVFKSKVYHLSFIFFLTP